MEFNYHHDENREPDHLREATPEDDRYAWRILILLALISVIALLLFYLFGGTLGDPFRMPPA